jgi:orsellinic acid C2-O-methyltransferase
VTDRAAERALVAFTAVPAADAPVVESVIHDWDDERSVAILSRARKAMSPHGVVFAVEPVLVDDPNAFAEQRTLLMSDLDMLVCTAGRERTDREFAAPLDAAGLRLDDVTRTGGTGCSVLQAVPA